MTFWLLITALIGLALAFSVPPLWFKSVETHSEVAKRKALNIEIYKERLAELDAAGLTPQQLVLAKQELEKTLLQEIETPSTPTFAIQARWSAALVLVAIPLVAGGLYWHTGSPQAILRATGSSGAEMPAANNEMQSSLESMVGKLAQRLEKQPGDAQGWEMLGRSYVVLERYTEAVPAFAKALELNTNPNAELLSNYAETIAMTQEGRLQGKPDELLAQALKAEAKHPKTLWLLGLSAVQTSDFATAIGYWETLKAELPPESEAAQSIAKHLEELKNNQVNTTATATPETPATTSTPPDNAAPPTQLNVSVTLNAALQAQANPDDILFIYARAASGPRMPLAILRKKVKDLPISVTLDDSMAMMPDMKLSSVPQVVAMARISKSGSAMAQSGDLLGESAALSVSETSNVKVEINQQVP